MESSREVEAFQSDLVAWAYRWRVPKSHILRTIDALMDRQVFAKIMGLDEVPGERPDPIPEEAWPELIELIERFMRLRHP